MENFKVRIYVLSNVKSNEITSVKTQVSIVKLLLDGSSLSQRKIAERIGREESTVSKAIDYLENRNVIGIEPRIIESGKRNKGKYKNNLCRLKYDINNGYNILYFFKDVLSLKTIKQQDESDIIETLQKNDKFLSILIKKHSWILELPIPIPEKRNIVETPGPETQPAEYEFNDEKEARICKLDTELNNTYLLEAEKKLKIKLELSADFFKICILNEPDNLKNIFDEIFWQTKDGQLYEIIRESLVGEQHINSGLFPPSPRNHPTDNFYSKCSDIIFKSCVYHDVLTGHKNAKAIEYLKKMIKSEMLKEINIK